MKLKNNEHNMLTNESENVPSNSPPPLHGCKTVICEADCSSNE
jgi:hypothetical protein